MTPTTAVETIRSVRHKLYEVGWTNGAGETEGPICIMQSIACVTERHEWEWNYDYDDLDAVGQEAAHYVNRSIKRVFSFPPTTDDVCGRITAWNDVRNRKFDQVVEVLERAEKLAEIGQLDA